MSGRRGRASQGRKRPQDCYQEVAGDLDDRPAFDSSPFDPSSGSSAWETLPTESIFESPGSRSTSRTPPGFSSGSPAGFAGRASGGSSSPNRLASGEHSHRQGASASGHHVAASPMLKKVLSKNAPQRLSNPPNKRSTPGPSSPRPSTSYSSAPFSSEPNSTRASELDFMPPYTFDSSPLGDKIFDLMIDSYGYDDFAYDYYVDTDDEGGGGDEDDDDDDFNFFASLLASSPPSEQRKPIVVDTSPLPPWKPYYASERLDDPNNPPPMFHPAFNNDWRFDPEISDDLRNFYASTLNEFSPNYGIFDYGRLSEFNTLNLYDPERFEGHNEVHDMRIFRPTPAYRSDDEVFGDPEEALARPTDDVPDKFRKEKWHYFELMEQLKLFKKLGMENDLAMYPGVLERMEKDPWTGDSSGPDVQVYVRGQEGDPALDDDLLERMEALCDPNNEGLKAFYAAMANPPPIRNEYEEMKPLASHGDRERSELPVAPPNEAPEEFVMAMETLPVSSSPGESSIRVEPSDDSPPINVEEGLDDSFVTCADEADGIFFDDTFQTCVPDNDSMMASAIEDHPLNTTFTLRDDETLTLNSTPLLSGDDSTDVPSDGC